jgi:hypothetical protein
MRARLVTILPPAPATDIHGVVGIVEVVIKMPINPLSCYNLGMTARGGIFLLKVFKREFVINLRWSSRIGQCYRLGIIAKEEEPVIRKKRTIKPHFQIRGSFASDSLLHPKSKWSLQYYTSKKPRSDWTFIPEEGL